ncbi:MAG: asparagine synthetase B family protein [Candidatus Acidiferrales bacterium]
MSGIVGIYHRDGAPVDRALLTGLTHLLSYRGPDARDTWTGESVGLGHTLLRTTRESLNDHQPATLDGSMSITADARLDSRAELIAELEMAGNKVQRAAPDSELILQSYAAWGADCVLHLRGDFAFAIWDARRKTLFCVRDHLGVKPFYYVDNCDLFLFGNTLECLRQHPEVSEDLNESAIADFLLFGLNCDNAATTFRDVRRLPPAHSLTVTAHGLQVRRYWTPPTDGRIRYRHADDYVEHFQVLLQAAIADRLRIDDVGILLSGGLDSASIAAMAREVASKNGSTSNLRAYTIVYESLIPDRDGAFARKVAEFLGIPIRCLAMDHLRLFDRWNDPEFMSPEPVEDPFFAGLFDQFKMIAADSRVVLSGEGSDNLMHFEMWPYTKDLFHRGEWARIFEEVPRYLWVRPSPWSGVRRRIKGLFGLDSTAPVFPKWIAPDFARRMNLEARWREGVIGTQPLGHPILPTAHASLEVPQWSNLFEHENPGVTRCPVEVRHPFMDLRLVNFLLSLPPFPWFYEKMLLRAAMAGRLPESVRLRPKTPLAGDPLLEQVQMQEAEWMDHVHWTAEVEQFINRPALLPLSAGTVSEQTSALVRPICLNFWLQSARRVRYNLHAEASNA